MHLNQWIYSKLSILSQYKLFKNWSFLTVYGKQEGRCCSNQWIFFDFTCSLVVSRIQSWLWKQCHVHALSHRSKYMSLMLGKVPNLQTFQKELHDPCPFCVDRNSCLISDLMTHVMKAWSLIFFLRTAAAVRSAAISCLWALLQSNLLSLQDAGQIMKDLLTQVHKLWIYYYISF